jgi:hypothetical protein
MANMLKIMMGEAIHSLRSAGLSCREIARRLGVPAGPCSIKIAVKASRIELSSRWVIAGSCLGELRHFQENLDNPPFQIGGRHGPALVSLRSTRAGPDR